MKIKTKELKGLGKEALDSKLNETYDALIKVRAQSASGANPKDLNAIKNLKKTIARIFTIQKQMEETQKE